MSPLFLGNYILNFPLAAELAWQSMSEVPTVTISRFQSQMRREARKFWKQRPRKPGEEVKYIIPFLCHLP